MTINNGGPWERDCFQGALPLKSRSLIQASFNNNLGIF